MVPQVVTEFSVPEPLWEMPPTTLHPGDGVWDGEWGVGSGLEGWKCCWVLISAPRGGGDRVLLVPGSFVRLWGESWTPHSWDRAVAGCIPAVMGCWEWALGRQKGLLGLFL